MEIDVTPKSATANAYVTDAVATTYLTERRSGCEAWSAATAASHKQNIIWGATLLDAAFDWFGTVRTLTQRMLWPRSGVRNRDLDYFNYDTIPEVLQFANAEMAFALQKADRTLEPALFGQGFSEVTAGSVRVVVDLNMVLPLIPPHIVTMLELLGEIKPSSAGAGGMKVVKLTRG